MLSLPAALGGSPAPEMWLFAVKAGLEGAQAPAAKGCSQFRMTIVGGDGGEQERNVKAVGSWVGRGAVQAVPGCSRKKGLQGRVALLSISST